MLWWVACLLGALAAAGEAAPPPKLLVMPMGIGGMQPELVRAGDPVLAHAIARRVPYSVASLAELDALWNLERLKDQSGCDDLTCMSEIAAAFSAQLMTAGAVSRLGDRVYVTLQLYDLKKRTLLRRVQIERDEYDLDLGEALTAAATELFAAAEAPGAGAAGAASGVNGNAMADVLPGRIWKERLEALIAGEVVCSTREQCLAELGQRAEQMEHILARATADELPAAQRGALQDALQRTRRELMALRSVTAAAAPPLAGSVDEEAAAVLELEGLRATRDGRRWTWDNRDDKAQLEGRIAALEARLEVLARLRLERGGRAASVSEAERQLLRERDLVRLQIDKTLVGARSRARRDALKRRLDDIERALAELHAHFAGAAPPPALARPSPER